MNNSQLINQDSGNTPGTTDIDFEKESVLVLSENNNRSIVYVGSSIVMEVLKVSDYVGYIAKYATNEAVPKETNK